MKRRHVLACLATLSLMACDDKRPRKGSKARKRQELLWGKDGRLSPDIKLTFTGGLILASLTAIALFKHHVAPVLRYYGRDHGDDHLLR